jgi:SNF2 family DNA or RNA helicase
MMPDTVRPEAREDWIEKHIAEMDVLIVHPKRVMTGLDLIAFPSLIWFQTGYSTHVLRQASARARRPSQTKPCKVYFLYYAGTIQEQALALMGEKEAASQALEGTFDTHALRSMMNGGQNDDIISALANTLDAGKKLDARAAWKATEPKHVVWAEGFLFDNELVCATA